jgi:hypothetical protein
MLERNGEGWPPVILSGWGLYHFSWGLPLGCAYPPSQDPGGLSGKGASVLLANFLPENTRKIPGKIFSKKRTYIEMNRKLQVGDIIKFSDGGSTYTILGIDISRPGMWVHGRIHNSHFHIQWVWGDRTYTTWSGDIEVMNQKLNEGQIIILNPKLEPIREIKKFTL